MPDTERNATLNALLIRLGRSLLQYIGQSWPWTEPGREAEREALEALVERQQSHVARLHDLLWGRHWPVGLGAFPDHSDMHYLSLEFVLTLLIENQRGAVAEVERALELCSDDRQAVTLLGGILAGEREILQRLEAMAETNSARAA